MSECLFNATVFTNHYFTRAQTCTCSMHKHTYVHYTRLYTLTYKHLLASKCSVQLSDITTEHTSIKNTKRRQQILLHTRARAHLYTRAHARTHTHTHTHTHMHTHMHTHTLTYTHTHTHTHVQDG